MPLVCAGFEPLDLLQSIYMIMKQLAEGRAEVENQYGRVVPWDGNPVALKVLADVFALRPFFEWRGLGSIAALGAGALAEATPSSTPSCASTSRASGSPTRRRASAARCSRAC